MKGFNKLIWISLFGVAFGLIEAAVVVYLRVNYYPEGFDLSIGRLPADILWIEIIREAATIVVLISVGVLTGRTWLAKTGSVFVAFGMWDIFYYVWLRIFIGWPETLLDWDVLFLIPKLWMGPVLAPLLVSLALVGCGGWIVLKREAGLPLRIAVVDWAVEIVAGGLILAAFLSNDGVSMPEAFPWWLFLTGLVGGVIYFVWRVEGGKPPHK